MNENCIECNGLHKIRSIGCMWKTCPTCIENSRKYKVIMNGNDPLSVWLDELDKYSEETINKLNEQPVIRYYINNNLQGIYKR